MHLNKNTICRGNAWLWVHHWMYQCTWHYKWWSGCEFAYTVWTKKKSKMILSSLGKKVTGKLCTSMGLKIKSLENSVMHLSGICFCNSSKRCPKAFSFLLLFSDGWLFKEGFQCPQCKSLWIGRSKQSQQRLTADLFLAGRTEGFNYPAAPKEKQSWLGRRRWVTVLVPWFHGSLSVPPRCLIRTSRKSAQAPAGAAWGGAGRERAGAAPAAAAAAAPDSRQPRDSHPNTWVFKPSSSAQTWVLLLLLFFSRIMTPQYWIYSQESDGP